MAVLQAYEQQYPGSYNDSVRSGEVAGPTPYSHIRRQRHATIFDAEKMRKLPKKNALSEQSVHTVDVNYRCG